MNQLKPIKPTGGDAREAWRVYPVGDSCLVLKVSDVFSTEANRLVARYARLLSSAVLEHKVAGVTDIVPAMVSVAVHYRAEQVACRRDECAFEALKAKLEAVLAADAVAQGSEARIVDIPVCYGGDYGPDLEEVAGALKLTPHQLIELHTCQPLDVLMMGFAPGHPYIGMLGAQLSPQRRASPRARVAAGSIGLANRQSVIYPLELPGGWHLIGRTPLSMFNAERAEPCLLRSGDKVRFVPIEPGDFQSTLTEEGGR
jgi:inhibitor of KinA